MCRATRRRTKRRLPKRNESIRRASASPPENRLLDRDRSRIRDAAAAAAPAPSRRCRGSRRRRAAAPHAPSSWSSQREKSGSRTRLPRPAASTTAAAAALTWRTRIAGVRRRGSRDDDGGTPAYDDRRVEAPGGAPREARASAQPLMLEARRMRRSDPMCARNDALSSSDSSPSSASETRRRARSHSAFLNGSHAEFDGSRTAGVRRLNRSTSQEPATRAAIPRARPRRRRSRGSPA